MSVTSVAIQFTIIDLLSRGVDRIKTRMEGLARSNKEVQKSFDAMARSAKYAAVAGVATREMYRGLKPAVGLAGDLQAEMLGTRAELKGSVKDAKALEEQLKKIKSTAFEVQAWSPFNQAQIVALEKELTKAGAKIESIVGPKGAAAASAALGTYEGLDPVETGKKLIGIATPFKLQAAEFMGLADQISRASSASTVGAGEIAETAKYAAPAMAQLGRSTHEMLVLSAMLAQRGLEASMAGTGLRQFFVGAAKNKAFRDAAGNLKPLAEITGILKKNLAGMGEAQKLEVLTKLFDMRGAPVAMALMEEGAASYEDIAAAMAQSLSLQEKIDEKMKGWKAQTEALRGTTQSTIASLFEPALTPLTALVAKMNEFVTLIGTASQAGPALGRVVSGASLGAVAVGGAATAGLAGAALWYGRKVLKGVGGVKGLFGSAASATAGIAAGKAVEAATGVTPVFVTNWPAGGLGGGTAADIAAGAAGGGLLGKAGALAKGGWKSLAGLATAATATVGGQFALAGAAGYGMGMGINRIGGDLRGKQNLLDDTALGDKIGELLNGIAALFGNEESKRAIEINMAIDQQGRVTTQSNDMKTSTNVNLKRGSF